MKPLLTFILIISSALCGRGAVTIGPSDTILLSNDVTHVVTYLTNGTAIFGGNVVANDIPAINVAAPPYNAGKGGDDTVKIQSALDAAVNVNGLGNGRQRVFIPMGSYNINGSLVVHPKQTLEGEGSQGSIVTYLSGGSLPVLILEAPGGQLVKGIYADGNKQFGTGIRSTTNAAQATTDFKIENVKLNNFRYGIYLSNAWNVAIVSATASGCGDGISIQGTVNAVRAQYANLSGNTNGMYLNVSSGSGNQISLTDSTLESNAVGFYGTNAFGNMRALSLDRVYFEGNPYPVWLDGGAALFQFPSVTRCFFGTGAATNVVLRKCISPDISGYTFNAVPALVADATCFDLNYHFMMEAGGSILDTSVSSTAAGTNIVVRGGYVSSDKGYVSLASNLVPPASVTVGASPFAWTNTTAVNVNVFVGGASTGTVAINGTAVFNPICPGTATVPLQPGEYLTLTYSGSPTMAFKPF